VVEKGELDLLIKAFPPLLRELVKVSMGSHIICNMAAPKHMDVICYTLFTCT
jgi:hypothetical protein